MSHLLPASHATSKQSTWQCHFCCNDLNRSYNFLTIINVSTYSKEMLKCQSYRIKNYTPVADRSWQDQLPVRMWLCDNSWTVIHTVLQTVSVWPRSSHWLRDLAWPCGCVCWSTTTRLETEREQWQSASLWGIIILFQASTDHDSMPTNSQVHHNIDYTPTVPNNSDTWAVVTATVPTAVTAFTWSYAQTPISHRHRRRHRSDPRQTSWQPCGLWMTESRETTVKTSS